VGLKFYEAFERTPWATDFLLAFTQRAIEAEQLGRDEHPDILTVSLSSTDYVGHSAGPDSDEIRELNLQTDRSLGQFFQYLQKTVGLNSTLIVFTADHGVAPLPEVQAQRRMPGGRLTGSALRKTVEADLRRRFGAGDWIENASETNYWLNWETVRSRGVRKADVEDAAAEALASIPQVLRVFTASRIAAGQYGDDFISRRVTNSYYPHRSPDVIAVLSPYWFVGSSGTSHGTPYSYDAHVPLVFMGPGIRPGLYDRTVAINDLAPTLATLLELETPVGSTGRVLDEMLGQPRGVPVFGPAPVPAKK
jgi:arylsulfatase A-like enzyme